MFGSVLIANRGEIACRIIRTCRRLGIRTIAVYSDADADALHVRLADAAFRIGPAPARESYLDIHAVIEAAMASGAEAVHPGYGFLAENAALADACADADLVFVGPPADVIRAMGEKHSARALVASAGLPVVPGYHEAGQNPMALERAAARLGFPLVIKAATGGGGRGMRIVERAEDFAAAVAAARREARAAFGDDRLILERFLAQARHIEVQVFGDRAGNVVHLFERDCSLQRRYQKIVEETPAPRLDAATRAHLCGVATAAANAVGYVGAGTVEMLVDGGDIYFMEMNTRLQVEHPVTEMVTGLDLVEWQLRVAAGEPLPLRQEEIRAHGHAVEARIYAEDPARDFAPSAGRLALLRLPPADAGLRIDAGVAEGETVGVHYDPLIAKVIAHGGDRDEALQRLRAALDRTWIAGVRTNVELLRALLARPEVSAGGVDTQFLTRTASALLGGAEVASDEALAAAVMAVLLDRAEAARQTGPGAVHPWSPWQRTDNWRLHGGARETITLHEGDRTWAIAVRTVGTNRHHLSLPGGRVEVRAARDGADIELHLGGRRVTATVVRDGAELVVFLPGRCHRLHLDDPREMADGEVAVPGTLTAPIPGVVSAVLVKEGAPVRRGEPLLVIEAMKMEHPIRSPADGTVEAVRVAVGQQVHDGAELARVRTADGGA